MYLDLSGGLTEIVVMFSIFAILQKIMISCVRGLKAYVFACNILLLTCKLWNLRGGKILFAFTKNTRNFDCIYVADIDFTLLVFSSNKILLKVMV